MSKTLSGRKKRRWKQTCHYWLSLNHSWHAINNVMHTRIGLYVKVRTYTCTVRSKCLRKKFLAHRTLSCKPLPPWNLLQFGKPLVNTSCDTSSKKVIIRRDNLFTCNCGIHTVHKQNRSCPINPGHMLKSDKRTLNRVLSIPQFLQFTQVFPISPLFPVLLV